MHVCLLQNSGLEGLLCHYNTHSVMLAMYKYRYAFCFFSPADKLVPYIRPDNWKENNYLNAKNTYEQMNGMEVVREMDFSIDPVFAQNLQDREAIVTNKGDGIVIDTGQLYKGDVLMIKLGAVMYYGHWNFQPAARIICDFFSHNSRDPEKK